MAGCEAGQGRFLKAGTGGQRPEQGAERSGAGTRRSPTGGECGAAGAGDAAVAAVCSPARPEKGPRGRDGCGAMGGGSQPAELCSRV